jgi:hypothetical protein
MKVKKNKKYINKYYKNMSVSELLVSPAEAWTNLYVNSLTANNLNFQNATVQDLTINGTLTMTAEQASSAPYFDAQKRLSSSVLTNGQLMIGSSGNPPFANVITGTANQVTVTNGSGSIVLSGPQDLAPASDPSFNTVTQTGQAFQLRQAQFQSIPNSTATQVVASSLVSTRGSGITYNVDGTFTVVNDGTYAFSWNTSFDFNATGTRSVLIFSSAYGGGVPLANVFNNASTTSASNYSAAFTVFLPAGSNITYQVTQNSGGALNASTTIMITKLS